MFLICVISLKEGPCQILEFSMVFSLNLIFPHFHFFSLLNHRETFFYESSRTLLIFCLELSVALLLLLSTPLLMPIFIKRKKNWIHSCRDLKITIIILIQQQKLWFPPWTLPIQMLVSTLIFIYWNAKFPILLSLLDISISLSLYIYISIIQQSLVLCCHSPINC